MADSLRRRRLELPGAPAGKDAAAIEKYLSDIRRLTMDEFNRLSGDFFDFRQQVIASATIPLASVASISVSVTAYNATFTWENPVQPQGEPTHVRVRIAEFGDTWQEFEYPITTWTAFGLNPSTDYTFQIQLVRRAAGTVSFVSALRNCPSIPVQVESLSEIRSRSFTTASGVGAPQDDGGTVVFPVPDTPGTPGPPGGANCWWEWQIQIVNLTTGEWEDTVYSGTVAGDAGQIEFDITTLDPLRVYRMKIREVCNGVPGPWEYGPPFTGGSDWLDTCGGNDPSASIFQTPFDSADLWAIPYACMVEAQGIRLREYLSGIEVIPGFGYDLTFLNTAGEWIMLADQWSNTYTSKLLASTFLPVIETLDNTDDLSIHIELWPIEFTDNPPGGFASGPIMDIGAGRLQFNLTYDELSNWGIQFVAVREVGGTIVLNSPLTLGSGFLNSPTRIMVTLDQDGDKNLYINGVLVASDTTGEEIRLDGISGLIKLSAFSNMFVSKFYGWNRAVEASEIAEAVSYIGAGASVDTSSGSMIVAMPDDWAEDDLVIIVIPQATIAGSGLSPIPTATGWTYWTGVSGDDDNGFHVLSRFMQAGDPDTVTVACLAADGRASAQAFGWRNVDTAEDFSTGATWFDTGDGTEHTQSGTLTGSDGDMALNIYGGNGGNIATPVLDPAEGFTMASVFGEFEANYNRHAEVAYREYTEDGAATLPTFDHGYSTNGKMLKRVLPHTPA